MSTTIEPTGRVRLPGAAAAGAEIRRFNWLGGACILGVVGLWQLFTTANPGVATYLPSPVAVAQAGMELIRSGELQADVVHTLGVTLAGWAIAAIVGIALGFWLGVSRTAFRYSMASVEVLRALPGVTFVPLAVLLLGLSSTMELAVVIYVTTWPILVNTVHGVHGVTPTHRDLSHFLRMTRTTRLRAVVMPSAAGHIIVGLRLGLAAALTLAVVAEMVANPAGMGHGITFYRNALRPEPMYAYIVSLGILGLVLNAVLMGVVRLALPGIHGSLGEGSVDG
jgi:ABC-type nitrate/sulfonate/bicarbonate transport system permease component